MGWPPVQGRARGRRRRARDRVALRRAAPGRDPVRGGLARRDRRRGSASGPRSRSTRFPWRSACCSRPERSRSPTRRPTTASRRTSRPSSRWARPASSRCWRAGRSGCSRSSPRRAGASAELHSLLPLVAAAVSRVSGAIESERQRAEAEFLLGLTEAALAAGSLDEMLATLCERVAADGRSTAGDRACWSRTAGCSRRPPGTRTARAICSEWELMRGAPSVLPAAEAALHSGEPVVTGTSKSPLVAGLVGRHLRDRVADRGRDRQPAARGRRAGRRRPAAGPASPPRTCGWSRPPRRTHRADDRAGAHERRAHVAPARRHRDPQAPSGGIPRGVARGGRERHWRRSPRRRSTPSRPRC